MLTAAALRPGVGRQDEAFELWRQWAGSYAPFSPTSKIMHTIADEWLLVNVVDNNYIHSQLADLFVSTVDRVRGPCGAWTALSALSALCAKCRV